MRFRTMSEMADAIKGSVEIVRGGVKVHDPDRLRTRLLDPLTETALFHDISEVRGTARWIIKSAGAALGITPASLDEPLRRMGKAGGRGQIMTSFSLAAMPYETARGLLRSAVRNRIGFCCLNIRHAPLSTAAVAIAAAIKEGYQGPIYLVYDFPLLLDETASIPSPGKGTEYLHRQIESAMTAGCLTVEIDLSNIEESVQGAFSNKEGTLAVRMAEWTAWIRSLPMGRSSMAIGATLAVSKQGRSTDDKIRQWLKAYFHHLKIPHGGLPGINMLTVSPTIDHDQGAAPTDPSTHGNIGRTCLARFSEIVRNEFDLPIAIRLDTPDPKKLIHYLELPISMLRLEQTADALFAHTLPVAHEHAIPPPTSSIEPPASEIKLQGSTYRMDEAWWKLPDDVRADVQQRAEKHSDTVFKAIYKGSARRDPIHPTAHDPIPFQIKDEIEGAVLESRKGDVDTTAQAGIPPIEGDQH